MKILFVLEHSGVGPLVPALRLLHDRGHSIRIVSRRVKSADAHRDLQALADECERITYEPLPRGRDSKVGREVRLGLDYLRYLEPVYRDSPKLRARARAAAPAWLQRVPLAARPALRPLLRAAERSLEPPAHVLRFLEADRPDLLLVTPLVDLGSRQADWLRAAKRLGIRTGYPVFSWDNLTNKGLVRDVPDLVLVWNDLQAREAEELHGIPADRIRITGAPVGDPWFGCSPSRTREELCVEVGLDLERPFVLYLCSSLFVAPDEIGFVPRWIERLRDHGGALAGAGFLIRPYPHTAHRWVAAGIEGPQVRIWPRFGESPHDEATRRNYFDSIHHAAAVVGINTTAQIESAIVGRPVHTVLADEYRATQEGTLHFRYLEDDDFGLLHVGRTFEEHAQQLERSLRGESDDGRNERFVRRFVRPLGLDRSATEEVVDAIEELGRRPAPPPESAPAYAPLLGRALPLLASRERKKTKRERTPADELRRAIDRLARDWRPVVAGPWPVDEISELLYWIPFLRWAQTAHVGLRERLYARRRPEHDAWYAGIGAAGEPPAEAVPLDPELVLAARPELARIDPARRIYHRLLEFAPLADGRGDYEGPYGVDAYLAVLAGRQAVVASAEGAEPDDLLVAETYLARPPFGRLEIAKREKRKDVPWKRLAELEEYEELCRARLEHLVPVAEPLLLISQIQRSGGTLLSQLFDGHPEVHAHPHELCIGKPQKWDWPPLDLADPASWFATLYEPLVAEWVETGYVKDQTARRKGASEPDAFPFVFSPKLQKAIFEARASGAQTEREVLDAYFTSYFNGWLDNQNLYGEPKRAVAAFTPRLSMDPVRVDRFFSAYPDGTLVSIVRDPRAWFASAQRHRKYYSDLDESIGLWRASAEAALDAAARYGERVVVLTYEALVEEPEREVAAIAGRIGISMSAELLEPTFNGRPIRANSSEAVDRHGILTERVDAFRDVLDRDTIARIEQLAGDLYERAAGNAPLPSAR